MNLPRRVPRHWTFAELPHPGDTIDFGEGETGIVLLLSTEQTDEAEADSWEEEEPDQVRHRYIVAVAETARVRFRHLLPPLPPGMTIATDRVDEMGLPLTVEQVTEAEESD